MTTIVSDTKDFHLNRYTIKVKLIPFAGGKADTIDLTKELSSLRIIKQYDDQVFPYYAMTVAVSVNVAKKIQAAWRIGKMYITMERLIPTSKSGTTGDSRETATGDMYIKDAPFQIMVCDGAPPNVPTGQNNDLVRQVPSVLFHMELSPLTPLAINKKTNNGAYHNLTMTSLAATLTNANAPKETPYKFYMAPSDNTKIYESVFIHPMNYVPAIRHIDKVYGMYAGKLSIFLDVDTGYILSSTKSTIGGPTDPTTVILEAMSPEVSSPNEYGLGSAYSKTTKAYRLRTFQRIGASVDGPAKKEVNGEYIKLVRSTFDERSGSNCRKCIPDSLEPLTGLLKERILWQSYDNPLTADRLRVETRENYAPTSLHFTGCDLKALNPNLQWRLVSNVDDIKPLEGNWRIKSMEAVLTKAPGTTESCSADVMCIIVPSMSTSQAIQK